MYKNIFPEHEWDMFQFKRVPKGYRKQLRENPKLQEDLVNHLKKKFNINKTSDWYLINFHQIQNVLTINISDVMNIVKKFYPDLSLKQFQFNNPLGSKKSQFTLKSMLSTLFPSQEIIEEYRHSDLDNLELDYYIPELKLAFEYQV